MASKKRFGWVKWVVLGVVILLAVLAFPAVWTGPVKAPASAALSNGKQIHLATAMLVTDGTLNNDKNLGWPGDLKARGAISTLSDFVNRLVEYDYLKQGDLWVFSGPGLPPPKAGAPFEDKNCIFKVFLVTEDDPGDTVFLMTKNAVADKLGYVVIVRKGGDYGRYKKDSEFLKTLRFPGNTAEESAENCLNPDPGE